jgi:hypothetical protein
MGLDDLVEVIERGRQRLAGLRGGPLAPGRALDELGI